MPFKEATFWYGTILFTTGIYFWIIGGDRVTIGIILTVIGLVMSVYPVIAEHYPSLPKLRIWVLPLLATWAALGYDAYERFHPSVMWIWVACFFGIAVLTVVVVAWFQKKHSELTDNKLKELESKIPAITVNGVLAGLPKQAPTPPLPPSKLTIHSANYRAWQAGGDTHDVTDFLRKIISGDSLVFDIENHNFVIGNQNFVPTDPLSGKAKRLRVSYSYKGEPARTIERTEHSRLVLPEDSEMLRLANEIRGLAQTAPIRISVISEQAEYNGGADCPLKLRFHLRNDSAGPIDVQYQDYRPELITLKKAVTEVFQIRLAVAWLPQPHGVAQIAVLPGQQFAGWIAADEGRFNRDQVDSHRGRIGTLVLRVNGQNLDIKL